MKALSLRSIAKCLCLPVLALLMMASCSKDQNGDTLALLATVPSDSPLVAVVNLEKTLKDNDIKVKDGVIQLSTKQKDMLDMLPSEVGEFLSTLSTSPSGITSTSLVAFVDGYNLVITGLLDNPETFRTFAENELNARFTDQDGIAIDYSVAIKGNQFWITHNATASVINGYTKLSNAQSWLSKEECIEIVTGDGCINAVGDINALTGTLNLSFSNTAKFSMILSTMFKEVSFVTCRVDIDKKGSEVELEAQFLDSKWRKAECLLPFSKIDANMLKEIGGNGDIILAGGINKKIIDKLLGVFGTLLPSQITSGLKQIDGTAAVVGDNTFSTYKGVVGTRTDSNADLIKLLNDEFSGANVVNEKKRVTFSNGTPSGALDVNKVADKMKGAYIGAAGVGRVKSDPEAFTFVMALEPDGNSLEVKADITVK